MKAADVDDVLLLLRGDETVAAPHVEILTAPPDADQVLADATLHIGGHLVVESRETDLHYDALVLAEHRTVLSTNLRIAKVDGGIDQPRVRNTPDNAPLSHGKPLPATGKPTSSDSFALYPWVQRYNKNVILQKEI